jgi:hypothetical protein
MALDLGSDDCAPDKRALRARYYKQLPNVQTLRLLDLGYWLGTIALIYLKWASASGRQMVLAGLDLNLLNMTQGQSAMNYEFLAVKTLSVDRDVA